MTYLREDVSQKQNIDEILLDKQPVQINGIQFHCQEAYYHQKLINGVQLEIKGLKGLSNHTQHIDYLHDNQEIIYAASSNIIIYNTNKRTFKRLTTVQGQIVLVKTHFEKMINRQYIIWIERQEKKQEIKINNQRNSIKKTKKQTIKVEIQSGNTQFIESYFSDFVGSKDESNIKLGMQQLGQSTKKRTIFMQQSYTIHIHDHTKGEKVYEKKILLSKTQKIKDIFLFYNHYKMYNLVIENISKQNYIISENLQEEAQNINNKFEFLNIINQKSQKKLEIYQTISGLTFNSQQNSYIFFHKNVIYSIQVKENMNSAQGELSQGYFYQQKTDIKDLMKCQNILTKKLQLEILSKINLDENIISIAINNSYLAILTHQKIYLYLLQNLKTQFFCYSFEENENILKPYNISFQRSNLLVNYEESTMINVFSMKNKGLKFINSTTLNMNNSHQIQKIFVNHINFEIYCVVNFYELQTRLNNTIQFSSLNKELSYVYRPAFMDLSSCLLTNSSQSDTKSLNISSQKYKKIHTCPWLSSYVIQTQDCIEFKDWKQSFQNKKCIALHPIGVFLLICFKEGFKIFIITEEGLINTFKGDTTKDIQACAISQYGNNIAIALNNSILIYDFYSCKKIRTISLSFGVVIQSVQYSGYSMVCTLKTKKIYLYNSLDQYKEILIFNPKTFLNQQKYEQKLQNLFFKAINSVVTIVIIHCIYYDPVLNFIIFSANNHIYFYNCLTEMIYNSLQFQHVSFIYYYANLNTLFLGTLKGQIVTFTWPNKPLSLLNEKRRFKAHKGRIIDIKVSQNFKEVITIGQDNSMCICSLTYISNLKELEGLELIEHLSGSIKISYDLLHRKGFSQYTHTKYNEKLDLLKQYQDEVLNVNFILPEERIKQKQQMLHAISLNKNHLSLNNKRQINCYSEQTNEYKLKYLQVQDQLEQLEANRQKELKELSAKNQEQYMSLYNKSQVSLAELNLLKHSLKVKFQQSKENYKEKSRKQQENNIKQLEKFQKDYQNQQTNLNTYNFKQLFQIQQQKKQFISTHLQNINQIINNYNNNNGMIVCRNNKLQNQIIDMKNKIEEFKFILYKLKNNIKILEEEKILYGQSKEINKKIVDREDKQNLGQIQKRYVKETQNIIEKNKQIDVFLIFYEKQKNTLIFLQKQLEAIQSNTEQFVQNILFEKKWRKQQNSKLQKYQKSEAIAEQKSVQISKEKIFSRNAIKNHIHDLNKIIKDIISSSNTNDNPVILQKLLQKNLISTEDLKTKKANKKQKFLLNKIIQEKQNKQTNSKEITSQARATNKSTTRRYKTQTNQVNEQYNNNFTHFNVTQRDQLNKKENNLLQKLNVQQKLYKRIKTQQIVFQNRKKKIYIQNEDLIQNYNNLMMENKTFMNSFKRQEGNPNFIKKEKTIRKTEGNPTPFELYLKKKNKVDCQFLKPLIVKRQ